MSVANIPFVPENTLDPAAGLNLSIDVLRALVQTTVIAMNLDSPPSTPANEDMYIVSGTGGTATGAWAGQEMNLAKYSATAGAWQFYEAGVDVRVVFDEVNGVLMFFDQGASPTEWIEAIGGTGADQRNATSSVVFSSGTATVDYFDGDYHTLALSANVTTWVFDNMPGAGKGATLLVRITQDSTPRTVAWPSSFKWAGGSAPAVSSGSGAVDILALSSFDNGTTWYATLSKAHA